MYNNNICKFPSSSLSDGLSVSSFVLETDRDIIKQDTTLKTNRAVLVVSGRGTFTVSNRNTEYCAGTLLFVFKNETVSCHAEEQTEYMYIDFEGSRADELFRRFNIYTTHRSFSGFEGVVPLWKESLLRAGENTIDLTSESVLLYTFSRIIDHSPKKSNIVDKMLEYSEKNFTDTNFLFLCWQKNCPTIPNTYPIFLRKKREWDITNI